MPLRVRSVGVSGQVDTVPLEGPSGATCGGRTVTG